MTFLNKKKKERPYFSAGSLRIFLFQLEKSKEIDKKIKIKMNGKYKQEKKIYNLNWN